LSVPDTVVVEGSTRLLVPETHSIQGPGKREGGVFFNRQMAFNRDVSVMFARAGGSNSRVLDAMGGTGARGVRLANEARIDNVTVNDRSEESARFISRNIELNSLSNCEMTNMDLRCLLAERTFDHVDLDPFGSPMPYLHAAIQGTRRKGLLAITATDTAPLSGAHRRKCERRYGARPLRGTLCHEAGLRILLGATARELAKFDRGMRPILCFYADHYFRAFVRLEEGAEAADASLAKLAYMLFDPETLERGLSPEADERNVHGPMWGGELFDREVVGRMSATPDLAEMRRCEKYVALWQEELDVPFFYTLNEVASHLHISPPRMDSTLERLREVGRASRTHITPEGFRTDVPLMEMLDILG